MFGDFDSILFNIFCSSDGSIDIVRWGDSELVGRDWENGRFTSRFMGYWPSLDDVMLYVEPVYTSDSYTLYSSPILLNGEICNLHFALERKVTTGPNGSTQTDYETHILGARAGLDPETGMADKKLIHLLPGDEIEPIYLVMADAASPNAAWQLYASGNSLTYTSESELNAFGDMGDVSCVARFVLEDVRGQTALSERFRVDVQDDRLSSQLWSSWSAGRDTAVRCDRSGGLIR